MQTQISKPFLNSRTSAIHDKVDGFFIHCKISFKPYLALNYLKVVHELKNFRFLKIPSDKCNIL